jgi:predicted RNA-binding protein with PUA domain
LEVKIEAHTVYEVIEPWLSEAFVEDLVMDEELVCCPYEDTELEEVIVGEVGAGVVSWDKRSRWFKASKTRDTP